MLEPMVGLFLYEEIAYANYEALKLGIAWYLVIVCGNFIVMPLVKYLTYFLVVRQLYVNIENAASADADKRHFLYLFGA